jgi:hypothetical protein
LLDEVISNASQKLQVEEVEGRKVNIAFINFFYGETFPFKVGASLHNAP